MKSIEYSRPAIRDLAEMPAHQRALVVEKIERFAATGLGDIKALAGALSGIHRLRADKWRLYLSLQPRVIRVERVFDRRDAD